MQQVIYCLGVKHQFTPVYHPAANPVERKNRDLKVQLAILVQEDHTNWDEKLAAIRFAMNTATSLVTGYTPAYLTFARELRTPDDNEKDLREVIISENFVPEITPKLLLLADTLKKARESREQKEEQRKEVADRDRREAPAYKESELVLVTTHTLSNAAKGVSAKFTPRRDGPYLIKERIGTSSYLLASPSNPTEAVGLYHAKDLSPYRSNDDAILPKPVQPLRRRGRPKKTTSTPNTETITTARRRRPPRT
ncbi:uncharacterized protein LOC125235149 [Leguminivora glycinivorella]|uniref:uncharacterized protein LOC125235149 n=1 Tax=Leguminivora glycinivorella TaxID=1035111 RepID=UPI00200E5454|nr:uncharacterized protein LOC125235149 [Leguminivora glycinivorella]